MGARGWDLCLISLKEEEKSFLAPSSGRAFLLLQFNLEDENKSPVVTVRWAEQSCALLCIRRYEIGRCFAHGAAAGPCACMLRQPWDMACSPPALLHVVAPLAQPATCAVEPVLGGVWIRLCQAPGAKGMKGARAGRWANGGSPAVWAQEPAAFASPDVLACDSHYATEQLSSEQSLRGRQVFFICAAFRRWNHFCCCCFSFCKEKGCFALFFKKGNNRNRLLTPRNQRSKIKRFGCHKIPQRRTIIFLFWKGGFCTSGREFFCSFEFVLFFSLII
ncbi:hypothetical protein EYD10_07146 [Varanus komodoensis]|nr:hypothetical protein EYD10_07146 [Varanus komodoensis]